MSLTVPLEDLNRLLVSAKLSKEGNPILSLNLGSTVTRHDPTTNAVPSGISISFEHFMSEDGHWSMSMAVKVTSSQTLNYSTTPSTTTSVSYALNAPVDSLDWFALSTSLGSSAFWHQTPPAVQSLNENSDIETMPRLLSPADSGESTLSQDLVGMFSEVTAMCGQPQLEHSPLSSESITSLPLSTDARADSRSLSSSSPMTPDPSAEGQGAPDTMQDTDVSAFPSEGRDKGSSQLPVQRRQKNIPCTEKHCEQQFMSEYTRRMHMAVHQNKHKKTFVCTQGCTESFSRQHDRFRHEVSQHGFQSDWVCETCRGFFSSARSLSNHKCTTNSKRWKIGVPKSQEDGNSTSGDGEGGETSSSI